MSMAFKPSPVTTTASLLGPTGKEEKTLPVELWSALERADEILRRYDMKMTVLCQQCERRGHPDPIVRAGASGDGNNRYSDEISISCGHATWRYRAGTP